MQKLSLCSKELVKWSSKKRRLTRKELDEKLECLNMLQFVDKQDLLAIKRLKTEIRSWLEKEDLKWEQRVKKDWYRLGDRNTKYFHACASQRRRTNRICSIQDSNGLVAASHEEIEGVFYNHFHNLFMSSSPLK